MEVPTQDALSFVWHGLRGGSHQPCKVLDLLVFDGEGTLCVKPEPLTNYAPSALVAKVERLVLLEQNVSKEVLRELQPVMPVDGAFFLVTALKPITPVKEWSPKDVRDWAVLQGLGEPPFGMDGISLSTPLPPMLQKLVFGANGAAWVEALKRFEKEREGASFDSIQLLKLCGTQQLPKLLQIPPINVYGGWWISPPIQGRRLALVIGNDAYQYHHHLQYAGKDSSDMNVWLKRQWSFHYVRVLENGNRDSIIAEMERILNLSRTGDTVLFYFSGHGSWFVEHGEQRSTIVPVDSGHDGNSPNRDVSMRELNHWVYALNQKGVKNVVLIMDSCCSAGAVKARGMKLIEGDRRTMQREPHVWRGALPNTADIRTPGPWWIVRDDIDYVLIAAAEEKSAAYDGVFTDSFLRAMAFLSGKTPSYSDICDEVCKQVLASAIWQRPTCTGSPGHQQRLFLSLNSVSLRPTAAVFPDVVYDADGNTLIQVERSLALYGVEEGAHLQCYAVTGETVSGDFVVTSVRSGIIYASSKISTYGRTPARASVSVAAPSNAIRICIDATVSAETRLLLEDYLASSELFVGLDQLPRALLCCSCDAPDIFVKQESDEFVVAKAPQGSSITPRCSLNQLNSLKSYLALIGRFETLLRINNPYSNLQLPRVKIMFFGPEASKRFDTDMQLVRHAGPDNPQELSGFRAFEFDGSSRFFFWIENPIARDDQNSRLYATIVEFHADFAVSVFQTIPLHEHRGFPYVEYPAVGRPPLSFHFRRVCECIPQWIALGFYELQFRLFFSRNPLSLDAWTQPGLDGISGQAKGTRVTATTQDWAVVPFLIRVPTGSRVLWVLSIIYEGSTFDLKFPQCPLTVAQVNHAILSRRQIPIRFQHLYYKDQELKDDVPPEATSLRLDVVTLNDSLDILAFGLQSSGLQCSKADACRAISFLSCGFEENPVAPFLETTLQSYSAAVSHWETATRVHRNSKVGVFYFSGHGSLDFHGTPHPVLQLCLLNSAESIPFSQFLKDFLTGYSHIVAILDCCHASAFGLDEKTLQQLFASSFERVDHDVTMEVIAACAASATTKEVPSKGLSELTLYLDEKLRTYKGRLADACWQLGESRSCKYFTLGDQYAEFPSWIVKRLAAENLEALFKAAEDPHNWNRILWFLRSKGRYWKLFDSAPFDIKQKLAAEVPDVCQSVDSLGATPLMRAAANGDQETVSLLLHHFPNMKEVKDIFDRTALHYAAYSGNEQCYFQLHQLGQTLDRFGDTPARFAAQQGAKAKTILLRLRSANELDTNACECLEKLHHDLFVEMFPTAKPATHQSPTRDTAEARRQLEKEAHLRRQEEERRISSEKGEASKNGGTQGSSSVGPKAVFK